MALCNFRYRTLLKCHNILPAYSSLIFRHSWVVSMPLTTFQRLHFHQRFHSSGEPPPEQSPSSQFASVPWLSTCKKSRKTIHMFLSVPAQLTQIHSSRELQQLDPGLHWFCDRRNVTAHTNGHTQSEIEERKPLLEDLSTDVRITSAINCLRIFAWDGPEVAAAKEFLIGNIDKQLGKCDLCIVGYYKAKRGLLASLRE